MRSLLYNCCPLGDTEWKLNVEQLLKYGDVFNGRRIILVKVGDGLAPAADVREEFGVFRAEFMEVPNDPDLGEVAGFVEGLARLESVYADEATFYAHTKGVSYDGKPVEQLAGVRTWRNMMYNHCLGDIRSVESALQGKPIVGCFKHYGSTPPMEEVDWHYAGTFFWMRHDALFSRDWRTIYQKRFGVEMYPGTHFDVEEASCLYSDGTHFNLYKAEAEFRCEGCGRLFLGAVKVSQNPIRPCPHCYKRKGVFVRTTGDLVENAPLLTEVA